MSSESEIQSQKKERIQSLKVVILIRHLDDGKQYIAVGPKAVLWDQQKEELESVGDEVKAIYKYKLLTGMICKFIIKKGDETVPEENEITRSNGIEGIVVKLVNGEEHFAPNEMVLWDPINFNDEQEGKNIAVLNEMQIESGDITRIIYKDTPPELLDNPSEKLSDDEDCTPDLFADMLTGPPAKKSKNQTQGNKTTNNKAGKKLDEIMESENLDTTQGKNGQDAVPARNRTGENSGTTQDKNGQGAEPVRNRTGENAAGDKDCPDGGPAEEIIDDIGDRPIPTNVRQLYGKNQRFRSKATMVELKDQIYCKDSNIKKAKSALSAAIHAKQLFSGVFTHDAIMLGTMSGDSYKQKDGKREYFGVLELDEKAIEVIVDETLDYAIFKKWVKEEIKDDPNMAGDLYRFRKDVKHSLSDYISLYKRTNK